jgi:hypothetical protein
MSAMGRKQKLPPMSGMGGKRTLAYRMGFDARVQLSFELS